MAVVPRAVQYADRLQSDARKARVELGAILGPIPRYLYQTLEDDQLALEIEKRWIARRTEMSSRIVMDSRLMRYMDPEMMQHHWQNLYTGEPIKKLQHSDKLSVGIYNWPRAIVEALTGLLAGGKPMAYQFDVKAWAENDSLATQQAAMVEKFAQRWISETEYERTFTDAASNIYALGRNWKGVLTNAGGPYDLIPVSMNAKPANVVGFWQSDDRTLECVITMSEMLPGEAAALYPEKVDEIAAAVHTPTSWYRSLGVTLAASSWNLNSTVSVLNCWYRSSTHTIGRVDVLLASPAQRGNRAVFLKKMPDSGYPDIPWRCTPRFKTNDRPPDEAQGALYDIAPIVTQYDEVVSAARDMLWRAIYQRYKLSNAYGRPPQLIPNTSIIALRAGQDLQRLDDVLNSVPVDTFINRLEELMMILPGLSRYSLGSAPPSETSGEAITAAINASITRQETTRTEAQTDERWMYRQIVGQAAAFSRWTVNGKTVSMAPVLAGDYDFVITWLSDNPREAVKAKQLAMAALRAGIISLDTAQQAFGVTNTQDEQRKIRLERQDPVLRPDIVALTEQVLSERQNRQRAAAAAAAPAQPPVKISLTGPIPPNEALALAEKATGVQPTGAQPAPTNGSNGAGRAAAASATVGGDMTPPQSENDNSRVNPPSLDGNMGQS